MSGIVRVVAFAFGLLGAVASSQGPEFSQQYRQRLGGAVDELRRVISRFDVDAQTNNESRGAAIARLRSDADDLASRLGTTMQANVERLERLEEHRQAMLEAGPLARVALLLRDGDVDVMRAAYREFVPALPVSEEGIVSATAGFITLWGGILLLAGFLRSLRRPRRRVLRA